MDSQTSTNTQGLKKLKYNHNCGWFYYTHILGVFWNPTTFQAIALGDQSSTQQTTNQRLHSPATRVQTGPGPTIFQSNKRRYALQYDMSTVQVSCIQITDLAPKQKFPFKGVPLYTIALKSLHLHSNNRVQVII